MVKGFFPYEQMTGPEWLRATDDIRKEDFFSSLTQTNCMLEQYVGAKKAAANWQRFEQQVAQAKADAACDTGPFRDLWRICLLEHYNELDVVDFSKAVDVLVQQFWTIGQQSAFQDACGIPGLARRLLARTQLDAVLAKYPAWDFSGCPAQSLPDLSGHIRRMLAQDRAKFGIDAAAPCSHETLAEIWEAQRGHCMYCRCPCEVPTFDRLDCEKPHSAPHNLVLACKACNAARGTRSAYLFWREKTLMAHLDELVCVLGRDTDGPEGRPAATL